MNPAALLAACETRVANIKMLLAWEQGAGAPRLAGLWAVRLRKVAPFWPMLIEPLPYEYAFLSNPVVDPAAVNEVMPAFLTAIEQNRSLPRVISLHSFDAVPALQRLVTDQAASPAERDAATVAIRQIERWSLMIRGLETVFQGASLASILLLMSVGLAIVFEQHRA